MYVLLHRMYNLHPAMINVEAEKKTKHVYVGGGVADRDSDHVLDQRCIPS